MWVETIFMCRALLFSYPTKKRFYQPRSTLGLFLRTDRRPLLERRGAYASSRTHRNLHDKHPEMDLRHTARNNRNCICAVQTVIPSCSPIARGLGMTFVAAVMNARRTR